MEGLTRKYENLTNALNTLEEAVKSFLDFDRVYKQKFTPTEQEKMYRVFRDSLIQHFEYTTDLFLKYLKAYLENKALLTNIISPATAIQESCSFGLITEREGHQLLTMVKGRNKTSHIYVEEIAAQIAEKIPSYSQIMTSILQRLDPNQ